MVIHPLPEDGSPCDCTHKFFCYSFDINRWYLHDCRILYVHTVFEETSFTQGRQATSTTPEMRMRPVHKQLKPVAILLLFQLLHHFCSAIKICNFWLLVELLNTQSLHAHFYHSSMFECHSWQGSRKRKSVSKTLQKWHFLSCAGGWDPLSLSPPTHSNPHEHAPSQQTTPLPPALQSFAILDFPVSKLPEGLLSL